MKSPHKATSARLEIIEAVGEERLVVYRLWQLFMYDMSEHYPADLNVQGLFTDGYSERETAVCVPLFFLFKVNGHWAGFARVERLKAAPEHRYFIRDFFIMKRYRRQGMGRTAANAIWDHLPGQWSVTQLGHHTAATAFWRTVIGERTGGHYDEFQEEGSLYRGQSFTAVPAQEVRG